MKNIDDMVYGHAQAKKVLQVLLKRSKERYYKKCVLGHDNVHDTLKCLLIGQSGTGKTHLIHSLRKLLPFPLICLDATQLMPTGNNEGMNAKQLKKLIKDTAKQYIEQEVLTSEIVHYHSVEGVINQMVIFVDEFDKLGTSFDSSGNWNKHVQANFLTLIDNKEEFAGISWIFAGAFSSLYEAKPSGIGFFSENAIIEEQITDKDIIKAGIIPEMLGRISLIVQLDTFTKEDYHNILVNRLLPSYEQLSLNEADIENIVDKAYISGQGIRSMTRQLEMLAIDIEYEEPAKSFHRT